MDRRFGAWWTSALVALLLALLPVLALLQLRGVDALVTSERVRLGNFVTTGVDRIAVDLERELASIEEILRDAFTSEETLADAVRTCEDQAGCPGLVRAAVWIDSERDASALDLWPSDAGSWPDVTRSVRAGLVRRPEGGVSNATVRVELPADPPGLLIAGLGGRRGEERVAVVVLLFDRERLRDGLLAGLSELHLGQAFGPPVEVVVAHGRRELFRSKAPDGEALLDDGTPPDARRSLAGGEVELSLGAGGREMSVRRFGGDPARQRLEVETEIRTDIDGLDEETSGDVARVVLALPGWEVRARHRAGSIAAAVEGVRRRNLALGLGVLAVLGGAALLLGRAARRARELARRQVEFVAGVTHELRTPLTVIRSAAENLRDDVVRRPEQARRYGALIHDEAARLTDLVEHALTLAGARGASRDRLRAEDIGLPDLLQRVVDRCEASSVRLEVPPETPSVRADASALERALINLLTNALKYAGPGAKVGIRAARAGSDRVAITVWDEGPGIPADEQPRVFEPFFRGRHALDSQAPGSGLGLAVVRDLARSLGGAVSVASTPGAGSAFTLTLPAATA